MKESTEKMYQKIGENVYRFRVLERLSQAQLAEKSQVSAAYVSQIEGFFSLIVDAAQAWYRDGLLESNVKLSVVLDSLKKFLADVTFFLREDVPPIFVGSCPTDGRNFLLTAEEYKDFIKYESDVAKLIRNYVGSNELINGITRYCLWLKDCPLVMKRVEGVPSKTNTSS